MKLTIITSATAIIATLILAGCKTTEANYRAAYEITKQKQTEASGGESTTPLQTAAMPKEHTTGGVTLPTVTEWVTPIAVDGVQTKLLDKYNVVAARFHQIFNAKAMRKRLADNGYPNASIAANRDKLYYVIARSCTTPEAAAAAIDSIASDKNITLRPPFPFILQMP